MSFNWAEIDEREKLKNENGKQLKNFLRAQQEEVNNRKLFEKQNNANEYRKLSGLDITQNNSKPLLQNWGDSNKQSTNLYDKNTIPQFTRPQQFDTRQQTNKNSIQQQQNSYLSNNNLYNENSGGQQQKDTYLFSNNSNLQISEKRDYETQIPPFLEQISPVGLNQPSNTIMTNEDILSKLRYTEEQLIQERRSRSWLESELQNGKSAKVESITDAFRIESLTIKEIQRHLEAVNKSSRDSSQEVSLKFEREQIKMQQTIAELIAKQRSFERSNEDLELRNRTQLEDLNSLRYRLEAFSLKSNETTQEARQTAHELDIEQQKAADNFRAIQDHDNALSILHTFIESSSENIKRNFEMSVQDIRQKLEMEQRSRLSFEHNMKELYSEVRKLIQNQERSISDRVDSVRQTTMQSFERERQEREKGFVNTMESLRALERSTNETEGQLIKKVSDQLAMFEAKISEEHSRSGQFESVLRGDVDDGFRIIQQSLSKRGSELMNDQLEIKQKTSNAIRSIQESILLVEKTSDAKFQNVEEVLRAEIRSRMEVDSKLEMVVLSTDEKLLQVQKALIEQLDLTSDEIKSENKAILDELDKTANQLSESKNRSIEDIELKLKQISKRIQEDELKTTEKSKLLEIQLENVKNEAQETINQAEGRVDAKILEIRGEEDELRARLSSVQSLFNDVKIYLEEKFNAKSVQTDQILEAFKDDLRLRLTIKDSDELESRIKTQVSSICTSINHLVQQNSDIKDEIEKKSSKKELDEIETNIKQTIHLVNEKVVLVNDEIAKTNEEIASKVARKEVEEFEQRVKVATSQLETRDGQIEEILNSVKEDLADRVFKKYLEDFEDRMHHKLRGIEIKEEELSTLLEFTKTEMRLKSTKEEFTESELKWSKNMDLLAESLNSTLDELKTDFQDRSKETYDQWASAFGKISTHLTTVESKNENLTNTTEALKLKMSDSERILRLQIKEAMQSQESVLNAELVMLEKIKEESNNQIKDLSSKIEDIPRTMHLNEMQYGEFKKYVIDTIQKEHEKTTKWLMEIRENVQSKVSEADFERMETNYNASVQKLHAQIDIEQMTVDQLRERIQEVEVQVKDRLREIRTFQERENGENDTKNRQERERTFTRFEDLQSKITKYPKLFDQLSGDLKRIKLEVEEKVGFEIHKIQKEIQTLKNEIPLKVSAKSFEDNISLRLSPVQNRIENIAGILNELQNKVDHNAMAALPEVKYASTSPFEKVEKSPTIGTPFDIVDVRKSQAEIIPGSFFKPTHINFNSPNQPIADLKSASQRDLPTQINFNSPNQKIADVKTASQKDLTNTQSKTRLLGSVDKTMKSSKDSLASSISSKSGKLKKTSHHGGGSKISLEMIEKLADLATNADLKSTLVSLPVEIEDKKVNREF